MIQYCFMSGLDMTFSDWVGGLRLGHSIIIVAFCGASCKIARCQAKLKFSSRTGSECDNTLFSGDPDILKEKLLSIPDHISNVHTFPDNSKYMMCPHPPPAKDRAKAWLAPGSLVAICRKKNIIDKPYHFRL